MTSTSIRAKLLPTDRQNDRVDAHCSLVIEKSSQRIEGYIFNRS